MDKRHYDHEKLKEIRKQVYTQDGLAERINRHPKTISRAETGVSASFKLLTEMCQAIGISVKDIIYEEPTQ